MSVVINGPFNFIICKLYLNFKNGQIGTSLLCSQYEETAQIDTLR